MQQHKLFELVKAAMATEDVSEEPVEVRKDRAYAARMERENRTPKYMEMLEGALLRAKRRGMM